MAFVSLDNVRFDEALQRDFLLTKTNLTASDLEKIDILLDEVGSSFYDLCYEAITAYFDSKRGKKEEELKYITSDAVIDNIMSRIQDETMFLSSYSDDERIFEIVNNVQNVLDKVFFERFE